MTVPEIGSIPGLEQPSAKMIPQARAETNGGRARLVRLGDTAGIHYDL